MQDAGIILGPILPVPKSLGDGGGLIHVSRNVMSIVRMLDALQINVLMVIEEALRPYLMYGSEYVWGGPCEIEIPIPLSIVSDCHDYSKIIKRLEPLTQIPVRYEYNVPGGFTSRSGTTCIVSTFEHRNRQYYARIPSASLPFYLFCGSSVGYIQPNRNLVIAMPGKYQKRLYIGLQHYWDNRTKVAYVTMSVSEFREFLGFGSNVVLAKMQEDALDPLQEFLKTNYSSLEMTYSYTEPTRRGRPSYSRIEIILRPRTRTDLPSSPSSTTSTSQAIISLISRYHTYWSMKGEVRPTPEIANTVFDMNIGDKLLNKVTLAEEAVVKKSTDRPNKAPFIMANIVKKILREDYGIEVFVLNAKKGK